MINLIVWLKALSKGILRRFRKRHTGKPQPPRPFTLQERIAALEPEIRREKATT
jgi:hypothetical protein